MITLLFSYSKRAIVRLKFAVNLHARVNATSSVRCVACISTASRNEQFEYVSIKLPAMRMCMRAR